MPATRGEVEHLLEQLGYERENTDHRRFRLVIGGREIAATKTSHGPRTIADPLLAEMARQMRIRPAFLRDLLAGRRKSKDYFAELRRLGILATDESP